MNKQFWYLLLLTPLFLLPLNAEEEDDILEEEVVDAPSNPQELLEVVRRGQFADTQMQRDRENKFLSEKNRQAKLLSDAKAERARLERIADQLEKKFEANEALLVVAEAQLKERVGSLNEIFGT